MTYASAWGSMDRGDQSGVDSGRDVPALIVVGAGWLAIISGSPAFFTGCTGWESG